LSFSVVAPSKLPSELGFTLSLAEVSLLGPV
jgi:hypothetical protein